jgi:hypothetical protein
MYVAFCNILHGYVSQAQSTICSGGAALHAIPLRTPDAFRHAYWSYYMTTLIGPDATKAFTDAHEREPGSSGGDRIMDLYNNFMGRMLATDSGTHNAIDPGAVIMNAISAGQLITAPPYVK